LRVREDRVLECRAEIAPDLDRIRPYRRTAAKARDDAEHLRVLAAREQTE